MKHTVLLVAILSLLLPSVSVAATNSSLCLSLTRNLRVGVEGEDVRLLQKVLNTNPATVIANSGVGSPGNETAYFGLRTQGAVAKFQELNRAEILTPAGLTKGSGYVGTFTRARLKAYCEKVATQIGTTPTPSPTPPPTVGKKPFGGIRNPITIPTRKTTYTSSTHNKLTVTATSRPEAKDILATMTGTTNNTTNNPNKYLASSTIVSQPYWGVDQFKELIVMYPSQYEAVPGEEITIFGTGFQLEKNTVYLGGSYALQNLGVDEFGLVHFIVPDNAPRGRLPIVVENKLGRSDGAAWIIIKNKTQISPTITSVSPIEGFIGTIVTITGTGFTPTDNDIYFPTGMKKNVSSPDGKTLTVEITSGEISEPSGYTQDPNNDQNYPGYISVNNINGVSNAASFGIKF